MADYSTLRKVVSDITNEDISLEERDRLAENEELLHLCKAYKQLTHAAHNSDQDDVWTHCENVTNTILNRLKTIEWRDEHKL